MAQWAQQRRTFLLILMAVLLLARLALDGLAALGVLPLFGQRQTSDLLLLAGIAAALSGGERQDAPRNWVARHWKWAGIIVLVFLFGAAWIGTILERTWHAPLGTRLIPDLLCALAFVFGVREFTQRSNAH